MNNFQFSSDQRSVPTNYSSIVKSVRIRTGLTQEEFAERLGTSFATVNRWENGKSRPSSLAWSRLQVLASTESTPAAGKQRPGGNDNASETQFFLQTRMGTANNDKFVTKKELAERYRVTVSTVDRWMSERRIPFFRFSRRLVRFNLDTCEDALRKFEVPCR